MKQFIAPAYTFTPGASGVGTVNLSGISGFNVKYLVSIINQTRGVIIYSTASDALKFTNVSGTTITLNADTTGQSSGDVLQVIYDDPANTVNTGLSQPLTDAQLRASAVSVSGTVTANTGLTQPLTDTQLRASAVPVSAASLPLPSGAATSANQSTANSSLASIDAKLPTAGAKDETASQPVVLSDSFMVTGPSGLSAVNTDLITGTLNGWYDAKGYKAFSVQIIASAGISAGQFTVEQTNDTSTAPQQVAIFEETSVTSAASNSAITFGASTARIYVGAIQARFFRVRITTGITGGTVQAVTMFSRTPYSSPRQQMVVGGPISVNGSAGNFPVSPNNITADLVSSVVNTNSTSASIGFSQGNSASYSYAVTAVSGTNPTLDVVIQESDDTGTNWYDIWHFPRITSTGIYRTPNLMIVGNRLRYVQTVGGTSPSFTRVINRVATMNTGILMRQIYDRSINVNSLNSTTTALYSAGLTALVLEVNLGAVTTTAPTLQLQGSSDNINWTNIGTTLLGVANSTVQLTITNQAQQFVRAIVTNAGSGATLGYVLIKGFVP